MRTKRISDIEHYVAAKGFISMTELEEHYQVSINTIRRDVADLIKRGVVTKVYGGICARQAETTLTPYEVRRINNEEAKVAICRKAASLVRDGDIIFIDSGTTTLQLIDFLTDKQNLTIVTNNLGMVMRAMPYEQINIIVLSGQLQRRTNSVTGSDTVSNLQRYNVRIAFMAATGLSTRGATNSSPMEYEIKRTVVENSEKVVLMVNQGKIGVTGLMTFAPVEDFDYVVTDKDPGKAYRDLFDEKRVKLLIADDEPSGAQASGSGGRLR